METKTLRTTFASAFGILTSVLMAAFVAATLTGAVAQTNRPTESAATAPSPPSHPPEWLQFTIEGIPHVYHLLEDHRSTPKGARNYVHNPKSPRGTAAPALLCGPGCAADTGHGIICWC